MNIKRAKEEIEHTVKAYLAKDALGEYAIPAIRQRPILLMFNSIGESKIPLGLLIFSSVLNIVMDLWMVAGLGLGVFGAALATLIAQGISAVFSLLIFFNRMRRYKSRFNWFDRQELHSMLRIAVPSVLQQSTVSIGMMIVQAVVNPFGTQALAGYAATMRVENVFSLIFVSIGNAVSPYVSQNVMVSRILRIFW